MKHLTYLKTKPSTFVALEKRLDALHAPVATMQKLSQELIAEDEKARVNFNSNPSSIVVARARVVAYKALKDFQEGGFLQSTQTDCRHAQSAMRRDGDSFEIYVSILNKVAALLREDIADKRAEIEKKLSEVDADVNLDDVRPLPALRSKLGHVETLLQRCALRSEWNDSLADAINHIVNVGLPEPATPPRGNNPGQEPLPEVPELPTPSGGHGFGTGKLLKSIMASTLGR